MGGNHQKYAEGLKKGASNITASIGSLYSTTTLPGGGIVGGVQLRNRSGGSFEHQNSSVSGGSQERKVSMSPGKKTSTLASYKTPVNNSNFNPRNLAVALNLSAAGLSASANSNQARNGKKIIIKSGTFKSSALPNYVNSAFMIPGTASGQPTQTNFIIGSPIGVLNKSSSPNGKAQGLHQQY
jgi:hypothetical protein